MDNPSPNRIPKLGFLPPPSLGPKPLETSDETSSIHKRSKILPTSWRLQSVMSRAWPLWIGFLSWKAKMASAPISRNLALNSFGVNLQRYLKLGKWKINQTSSQYLKAVTKFLLFNICLCVQKDLANLRADIVLLSSVGSYKSWEGL